ncbi:hypothetical protein FOL47_005142 [Perkinsus chesapeaki]|uniref:Uncharacterized protein n=1 Tax=Perkinsus chesapeaki TaxID=330153 RepID=A0A7J6LZN5_PERCH|nr:hypothetical protein FOL47_005142 [Perkinsus chesapeaki]
MLRLAVILTFYSIAVAIRKSGRSSELTSETELNMEGAKVYTHGDSHVCQVDVENDGKFSENRKDNLEWYFKLDAGSITTRSIDCVNGTLSEGSEDPLEGLEIETSNCFRAVRELHQALGDSSEDIFSFYRALCGKFEATGAWKNEPYVDYKNNDDE